MNRWQRRYLVSSTVIGRRVQRRLRWSRVGLPALRAYRAGVGSIVWRRRPAGLRRTFRRGAR